MQNGPNKFNYLMPTKVIFGKDKINQIGEEASKLGSRALIVTGRTSAKKFGFEKKVTDILQYHNISYVVYDQIEPNPDRISINNGAKVANEQGCDLIIGLGGGSVLDAAKGISLVAVNNEDVWNYVEGGEPAKEGLPLIAVPTTAGTGSEVTPYAVVSDKSIKRKDGFGSIYNFPKVSILDPSLTLSLSHLYTISTGLDALAHALEAYTSSLANKMSDVFAREAIKIIGSNLRKVSENGSDLDARSNMLYGNMLAGIALANADLTIAHVIGEAIGANYDTDHGLTVGLVLPAVMEYNFRANPSKNAAIAHALGFDVSGLSQMDAASKSCVALKNLLKDIKYPSGLRAIGVELSDSVINLCLRPGLASINPVELGRKEIKEIIEKSL